MGSMLELGNNETARLNEQQSGMNELFGMFETFSLHRQLI